MRSLAFAGAAALALFAGSAVAQDETKITVADVPQVVLNTAKAAAHGGISDVAIDIEGGLPVYEFKSNGADGKSLEIDVLLDGTIEEVEYEIGMGDLPPSVAKAVSMWAEGLQATMVERSERPTGDVVYELEGTLKGAEVDIEVTHDGSIVTIGSDMVM